MTIEIPVAEAGVLNNLWLVIHLQENYSYLSIIIRFDFRILSDKRVSCRHCPHIYLSIIWKNKGNAFPAARFHLLYAGKISFEWQIYVFKIRQGCFTDVKLNKTQSSPSPSPDGSLLAYVETSEVIVISHVFWYLWWWRNHNCNNRHLNCKKCGKRRWQK